MATVSWILVSCLLSQYHLLTCAYVRNISDDIASEAGDLNLAILLGHRGKACHSDKGYFNFATRAFLGVLYNIHLINQDPDILPHHTLGYVGLDSCLTSGEVALAQALRFLPQPQAVLTNQTAPDFVPPIDLTQVAVDEKIYQNVVGMIGPHTSDEALSIVKLMQLFQIPIVSFSATSVTMSEFDYFFRVIAADDIQGEAIVEFVHQMNWTCISMVYSPGEYGSQLAKQIKLGLEARGVCVAVLETVFPEDGQSGADLAARKVVERKDVNVVIAILLYSSSEFIQAMAKYDKDHEKTILGSEAGGWTILRPDSQAEVLTGGFQFLPFGGTLGDDYLDWVGDITYKQVIYGTDPFLKYFWQTEFSCVLDDPRYALTETFTDPCIFYSDKRIADSPQALYRRKPHVGTQYAVRAFAHALDLAIKDRCPQAHGTDLAKCITGEVVHDYLGKIKFQGPMGSLSFTSNGDVLVGYSITNIQGVQKNVPVGVYDSFTKTLSLEFDKIQWKNGQKPESSCNYPCFRSGPLT